MVSRDLFGNEIEEEVEEEFVEEKNKTTVFDFINSVSETKKDLVADDPDSINNYAAYIVNRGLGYFPDTVLYANEMNLYPDIPKKAQYYYYLSTLRKRQRRSKWFKLEENPDIEMIKRMYNVRAEVAKEYLKILSKEDLKTLHQIADTGEAPKKSTKRKKNK